MQGSDLHVKGRVEMHACANYSVRTFPFIYFISMAIALVGSEGSNLNFHFPSMSG